MKYHGKISVCDLLQIILTPCCRRTQIIQSFWSWSACTLFHHSSGGKFLMIDCTEPFVYPQVIWKMCLRREGDTASCGFPIWVFEYLCCQTANIRGSVSVLLPSKTLCNHPFHPKQWLSQFTKLKICQVHQNRLMLSLCMNGWRRRRRWLRK